MIEQVMVFALGFLIAGLAALAFAPVFWARAVRLSVRRIEMQLPLSMREILADRDHVRAESAIEQRRVELKAEALNNAHAASLAELGRSVTRIAQLQEHISGLRQTYANLSLDHSRLNRAHAELSAEASALSKELYDLSGLRQHEKTSLEDLRREHESLLALSDEQRASLSALSACGAALEARLFDTERTLETTRTMLCNKEAEATLLASHLERARDDLRTSETAHEKSVERYERERGRGAELEARLKEAKEAQKEASAKIRDLIAKSEKLQSEMRQASERGNDMRLRYDSLTERSRSAERGLIDRIERLRAENAALQGALGASRQECANLSRELANLRPNLEDPAEAVLSAMADEAASLKAHRI